MADKNIFETVKETAEKITGPSTNQGGEWYLNAVKDMERSVTDVLGSKYGGTIRPVPEGTIFQPRYSGGGKTYSGQDYNEAMEAFTQAIIDNSAIADVLSHRATYPEFTVKNGKVTLSGESKYLNSDVVKTAAKTLQDYYKGYDLTNKQVAESFQKSLDGVNEQIKANLQYQEYNDYLKETGFSDKAYRNYALAKQETDPKTTTNVTKSTKKLTTYDKNGKLQTWTPEKWLEYWTKNYNPEERAQLWMDSAEALARASQGGGDVDLYSAIPYLIMGSKDAQNIPGGFLEAVNIFKGDSPLDFRERFEAGANLQVPVYGFDDVDPGSVFIQTAARQMAMRGLSTAQLAAGGKNPWLNFGATNASEYFGTDEITDKDITEMSRDEYQEYARTAEAAVANGFDTYEKMKKEFGEAMAKKLWIVHSFAQSRSADGVSPVGDGRVLEDITVKNPDGSIKEVIAEAGDYPGYDNYRRTQYTSPITQWLQEPIDDMNKYVGQMSVYAPTATSLGIVAGTVASVMAEQAALGLVTGGALTASNIAKEIMSKGWRTTGKVGDLISTITTGQKLAATAPNVAKAIAALSAHSGDLARGLGTVSGAAKTIYGLGAIGTWALREVGEDAIRGIVDDVVMQNSLDSQGNLDPQKFLENVYMNAIMYGITKGAGSALKGLAGIVGNAKTRNIDGVELNTSQRYQLDMFQKALDDQNTRILFRGFDENGHPVIVSRGRLKVLDQLTASGETAKAIEEITSTISPTATRTLENILEDENVPAPIKEKITAAIDDEKIDTSKPGWEDDVKTRLQETLSDDEIREAFPDGVVKIGDETVRIDTKEFTSGDVNRANGLEFKTMDDAIEGLRTARTVKDFVSSINGIMRTAVQFAANFKRAVEEFAQANNMSVRDVMIEIRNSRIAGHETIAGLKELWDTNWKPVQEKLLDIQEARTGIRPVSHDFYFRDMIEGTFKPGENGTWDINNGATADILSGDSMFDLAASSTAKNTGKLGEIASDKLEYDPEVLAREFVASRLQTIWGSDDMGKTFAAMQEAHDAGEYDFTEAQAIRSVAATEQVAGDVDNSAGVKALQDIANVEKLDDEFGTDSALSAEEIATKEARVKELDDDIKVAEAELDKTSETYSDELILVAKGDEFNVLVASGNPTRGIQDYFAEDVLSEGTFTAKLFSLPSKAREALNALFGGDLYRITYKEFMDRLNSDSELLDKADNIYASAIATVKNDAATKELQSRYPHFNVYNDVHGGGLSEIDEIPQRYGLGEKNTAEYYAKEKGQTAAIIEMSPDDYLREIPNGREKFGQDMLGSGINRNSVTKYAEITKKDSKMPMGFIDYSDKSIGAGQEGRHRALAAEQLGVEKMPVKIIYSPDNPPAMLEKYTDITNDYKKAFVEARGYKYDESGNVVRADGAEEASAIRARIAALSEEKVRLENEINAAKIKEVSDTPSENLTEAQVESAAKASKAQAVNTQKAFNDSAKRSNAAELISRNSGYRNRATRVNPGRIVGVNYMPGNPFGKIAKWFNDHFVKANSIKCSFSGYKADGTPTVMSITAYNGGYKMYAEAGSFARNVIVDVQNGMSLWEAINKQVTNNGFFIEPSKSQRAKYGALTVSEQAAKVTDKIMDRMTRGNFHYKWSDAFNDDGSVRSTDALLSILTTRFRGQGVNDFAKFLRKADWNSFTKEEQSWLNKRMYEMTASVNTKTKKISIDNLAKWSMGLRYRSNMWFNFKNGQLQLTECQRLFTMNKIGDFKDTLKRLLTDREFRQRVSDYAYIMAAGSAGAGFSKADLDNSADAAIKLASESTISKNGIVTDIDRVKAKFKDFDDTALGSIEGGEYAKNYILIAGFLASGEKQGLEGAQLDTYIRNRFNTEALAGTNVGKIGLTDSTIGQFAFMYLGFPIRDLTLQWHMLKGGGIRGDVRGSLEYLAKMLGAKGLVWAMEAPWGYSLMDQIGLDPFGLTEQYDQMPNSFQDRDPVWRWVDEFGVRYNPFLQGAMTSALADIYFSYRAAEETAREEYKEAHNGSTEGFEWSLADAGGEMWGELLQGLTPGYTAYSRAAGEVGDLDRGYHISQTGNRLYETNTDLPNVAWGFLTGRRNTANAQDYYQTANPIRGLVEGGLPGLGQQIGRANPFRGFREFDPIDPDTYQDWFDGSYQDQQNWNTGIYSFREEAQAVADKYNKYANAGTAVNDMASRENELADLRNRVEAYVNAYTRVHPEGISGSKQNQLISIFSLDDNTTLDQVFNQSQGQYDNTAWDMAENRYSQGNFPTAYGLNQNKEGETSYVQSPQLEQVLGQQRYGINSEAAPLINRLYNSQKFSTPDGNLTMKEYHDKVYSRLQSEWNKSKPDYGKITKLQEEYIKYVERNVIVPTLETYGAGVLSAGKSSDIMQEFGRMLNGMIPSDDYRVDKYGKKIYRSTPYMTVDIQAWLKKNYGSYKNATNTTDKKSSDRIKEIRNNVDRGRRSVAKAQAQALINDLPTGKASLSRDELEWLQGLLND